MTYEISRFCIAWSGHGSTFIVSNLPSLSRREIRMISFVLRYKPVKVRAAIKAGPDAMERCHKS
jgi:hypothetical protein